MKIIFAVIDCINCRPGIGYTVSRAGALWRRRWRTVRKTYIMKINHIYFILICSKVIKIEVPFKVHTIHHHHTEKFPVYKKIEVPVIKEVKVPYPVHVPVKVP